MSDTVFQYQAGGFPMTSRRNPLLHQVGEALYGPGWQTDLARAIGVPDLIMRRWASGTADVPENAWRDIHLHAEARWRTIKYFDEEIVFKTT